MGGRHAGRKLAIQLLYQAAARNESVSVFIDKFIEDDTAYSAASRQFGSSLALGTNEALAACDALIEQYAIGWTLSRISLLDLSILRLAFYELTQTDTSPNIVLNEAVELSKEFSSQESPKFINGILGNYVKKHVHRNCS